VVAAHAKTVIRDGRMSAAGPTLLVLRELRLMKMHSEI